MAESTSHKRTAKKLADKYKTTYNDQEGVDINTRKLAIEVETEGSVKDGIRQLQGHRKPVYIAGANAATVNEALEATQNNTVGVMDKDGNIIKRSTRKK